MSDPVIVFAFVAIVLAPCFLAFVAWNFGDDEECIYVERSRSLGRFGKIPAPLQATLPERPVSEEFEIRSFPKGLSQRRLVVRDTEGGAKLTITQVREAAIELVKLGGLIVAHELALVAAAMVAAGKSAAAAACELLAWKMWHGSPMEQIRENGVWDQGPPRIGPSRVTGMWRETTLVA